MNKYTRCPACGGAMENLFERDHVEVLYCADCKWEWQRTHDLIRPDDVLAEKYGE